MVRKLLNITVLISSFLISGFVNPETGWEYEQSTFQAFYIFENLDVDGEVSIGDGCVPNDDCDGVNCYCCSSENTCDVIGAFHDGTCIGWVYSDSEGYTTVPAMGNDGNYPNYPSPGEEISFKLYDATYGTILSLQTETEVSGWGPNNEIVIVYGLSSAENDLVSGCIDEFACNYDESAVIDDGSCVYESGVLSIDYEVVGNSVELSWSDPAGVAPFIYLLNGEEVVSPLLIQDLDWGEEYSYVITTIDSSVSLGYCEAVESEVSVYIDDEPLPVQISGLMEASSEGRVILSWDEVSDHLEYYNIYVYNTADELLEIQSVSQAYFIHDNLLPNFTYRYSVEGVNSQGFSGGMSETIDSTTLPLLEATIDSLDIGQGYIILNWSIDDSNYNGDNYIFDVYQNGEFRYTSFSNGYLADQLEPGEEYCFVVVPKIYTDYLGNDLECYSNQSNEVCGTPFEITSWSVLTSFNVQGWGEETVSDLNNELGMHSDATDLYDNTFDVFEPLNPPNEWASFYFPHPDWYIELGDNFTSDFRLLEDLSGRLEVWDAEFISDVPGPASLSFDFINLEDAGNWPVYLNLQTTINNIDSSKYYRLSDNSQIDFMYMPENQIRTAQIIIGNSIPGIPIGFTAEGGPRRMNLSWDQRELCIFDEPSCNNLDNRYAATGYKIFRDDSLVHLITLKNNEITLYLDQLYVNDNEMDIEVSHNSEQGNLLIDCYESYSDSDLNSQYNVGEDFIDCGLDGLCPEDEGYTTPDQGENDGICNRFAQYNPAYNFTGEDVLIVNDPVNGERQVMLRMVDTMVYEHTDEALLGSNYYSYQMIAYNHAGDSGLSASTSAVTDPNILPVADAGIDQTYYLYGENEESVLATLPLNEDGTSNNYSYDPDAFDNEYLIYSWEMLDGDNWVFVSDQPSFEIILEISDYDFRHRVMDVTGMWSPYNQILVEVKGLPAPAPIENFNIESDLYYLELSWDRSYYENGELPDGYDDTPYLASYYEIYYDGGNSPIATISESEIASELVYVDNGLLPSLENQPSEYCYLIYGVNSQGEKSVPATRCAVTGAPPSVNIVSPNGADILLSGETYNVLWGLENAQYIKDIEVFYNPNVDSDLSSWESIYYSDNLTLGDMIDMPEVEGVTYDNMLKIIINDHGDYNGDNSQTYFDETDYSFIISSDTLQYNVLSGVNLVGMPLALDNTLNFVDHLGSEDDNLEFFIMTNQYGDSDFNLDLGRGYYLLNTDDGYFSINGDLLSESTEIYLDQGWNLISSPLVANIAIEDLKILNNNEELGWNEATSENTIISPIVIGYDNINATHFIADNIVPFQGYWIHSLVEGSSVVFESLPYDEDVEYSSPVDMIDSKIKLIASEASSSSPAFSIKDFVVIGMNENADEGFLYGEDIYDYPPIAPSQRFSNMFINHQDWLNSVDSNGNLIESPRFIADIRPFNDAAQWNISGEFLGAGSSSQIRLDWIIDGDMGSDIKLIINGREPIDMLTSSFIDDLTPEEFQNFSVQMGEALSNDDFSVNEFKIDNLYPNPFNPSTSLKINIPVSDNLEVFVYDISGNLIDVLYSGYIVSGQHKLDWIASNQASGVYFFKVNYQSQSIVKKAILIK